MHSKFYVIKYRGLRFRFKKNDVGVGEWDTPQEFLDSDYNSRRDKESRDDFENYNGFAYEECYQIETTPEQDKIMRNEFEKMAKTQYDLLDNNCATIVQSVLRKAGIPSPNPQIYNAPVYMSSSAGLVHPVRTQQITNIAPKKAFNSIIKLNPNGTKYSKTKK